MGIEKTFVFTKPENSEERFKIFSRVDYLLNKDLGGDFTKTNIIQINPVPELIIRAHYQHISEVPIYKPTIQAFLESKEGIFSRVYWGDNIVKRMRIVAGDTDPQKAKQGTIRQRFSDDSMRIAWQEKRYLNNVFHCSDSPENGVRETKLWRPYLIGIMFSYHHTTSP